jgi:hypothetical protein
LTALVAAVAAACAMGAAQAAPPLIAGSLGAGGTVAGSAAPSSGPYGPAANWQFWTFEAVANLNVTVTVLRQAAALDPVFGVWYGVDTDTANYFDMFSSSVNTTWFGSGDDELPAAVPGGPGGDARLTFTPLASGTYLVAVGNFASANDALGYQLSVAAVPEPGTYALFAAGLAALVAVRRRARAA